MRLDRPFVAQWPSRLTTVYPVSLSYGVNCVDVDEVSLLLASSCAASFHCAASISRSLRNTGSSVPSAARVQSSARSS